MRKVARAVLLYIYVVEDAVAKEAEEAREQGDQDEQRDHGGPSD